MDSELEPNKRKPQKRTARTGKTLFIPAALVWTVEALIEAYRRHNNEVTAQPDKQASQ